MEKNGTNKDAARIHSVVILVRLLGKGKSSSLFHIRVREGEKQRNVILEEKADERM